MGLSREPDAVTQPLLPQQRSSSHTQADNQTQSIQPKSQQKWRRTAWVICLAISAWTAFVAVSVASSAAIGYAFPAQIALLPPTRPSASLDAGLEACAWSTLQEHVALLNVPSITREEFLRRQAVLATALDAIDADAFIAEPSASSTYFANISASYSLSERPFLIIIDRNARFSYLAPRFELDRIADLDMVYPTDAKTVIEWREEESPYTALKDATGYSRVVLDEHARFMIASGLHAAGIEVLPAPQTIQTLRAVKTDPELIILRAINEFTQEVVRSLQRCLRVGMTQAGILSAAQALFTNAGVGAGFWALVLLGDQAANPHGGDVGDRVLQDGEFVVMDIGSNFHGYESDVTRTILPSGSTVSQQLLDVWQIVYDAQSAAIGRMRENNTCASLDQTARKVIVDAGYGKYFTHRLGHGLGLEGHEHPYLNGANNEKLKLAEVVTNEPGIYVTNSQASEVGRQVGFGIRIEDAILVTEEGGVVMTKSRAKSPYEP